MEVGESFALERADGSRAKGVDFGDDRIRDDEKFDAVGKERDEEGVNDDDALMGGCGEERRAHCVESFGKGSHGRPVNVRCSNLAAYADAKILLVQGKGDTPFPRSGGQEGTSMGVVGLAEIMWVLSVLMPRPEYDLNWLMRGMASMMVWREGEEMARSSAKEQFVLHSMRYGNIYP